ncbi:carbamoyltransferase family protein [Haloarcula sp. GH36]|uniref:carbamoyltransferase family protein n=1 Tax=Haloarcula montana TaxID=3111776 RepID=UPI002D78D0C2|nr:carbamoyltransferase C-terminal domain-containing protein [Haloarcula sp. GH36]
MDYILSFKPCTVHFGMHDPSAAIFNDADLVYAVEEERHGRRKHAPGEFPAHAIRDCLDHCDLILSDISKVVLPYEPGLYRKQLSYILPRAARRSDSFRDSAAEIGKVMRKLIQSRSGAIDLVRDRLSMIGTPVPPIQTRAHHACHAASAFHLSPFDEALVLTVDGIGDHDCTVVWRGTPSGLDRIQTYENPNSLGKFYAIVTEFLGYHQFNGEGKVMGLAPYGRKNEKIFHALRSVIDVGASYDVTALTEDGVEQGVEKLERALGRERTQTPKQFDDWEKDLAFAAQRILEEIAVSMTRRYLDQAGTENVALAGGVALNCKMNKRIMEMPETEAVFIQPVAHDAGLALGGPLLDYTPDEVAPMSTVYWGPEFSRATIEQRLQEKKIPYSCPNALEKTVAHAIADGALVGWFQGRLELGPRALGNRSILADPRTTASRDRVNRDVKHREEWRPFAPSLHKGAMSRYFENDEPAPYMIKTFDACEEHIDEIEAVVHPGDNTARPQSVSEEQNPMYYSLIDEFETITGVPVLLNTSFNDHGEPIVRTPEDAIKDFYNMGLDMLVLGDLVVEKTDEFTN